MKNLLIITYWSFKDPLIQTYTLPYVRIIKRTIKKESKIFFVTFENEFYSLSAPEKEQVRQQLADENIFWFPFSYSRPGFLLLIKIFSAVFNLWWITITRKISYIHVWCTLAGSFGYILSKLTGIPLIIDSYEPHAEPMVENGTWRKNSLAFYLLFTLEKLQSHHAKFLIATSNGMKDYAKIKFNTEVKKISVKPSCVDLNLFSGKNVKRKDLIEQFSLKDKIVCVYAGKFGGIYLEQEVFDFFKIAHEYWKEKFRILLLTSISREQIEDYAEHAGLDKKIIISKFVEHKEIPTYLALADFAINPVKPVPTKKYCTSIKDGEYWAMGLPVVITKNISDDSNIIKENKIGTVIESLNKAEYLVAIEEIDLLLHNFSREELYQKIRPIAEHYRSFSIAEKIYHEIYSMTI